MFDADRKTLSNKGRCIHKEYKTELEDKICTDIIDINKGDNEYNI